MINIYRPEESDDTYGSSFSLTADYVDWVLLQKPQEVHTLRMIANSECFIDLAENLGSKFNLYTLPLQAYIDHKRIRAEKVHNEIRRLGGNVYYVDFPQMLTSRAGKIQRSYSENISHLPIYALHGKFDFIITPTATRFYVTSANMDVGGGNFWEFAWTGDISSEIAHGFITQLRHWSKKNLDECFVDYEDDVLPNFVIAQKHLMTNSTDGTVTLIAPWCKDSVTLLSNQLTVSAQQTRMRALISAEHAHGLPFLDVVVDSYHLTSKLCVNTHYNNLGSANARGKGGKLAEKFGGRYRCVFDTHLKCVLFDKEAYICTMNFVGSSFDWIAKHHVALDYETLQHTYGEIGAAVRVTDSDDLEKLEQYFQMVEA